jgi:sulfur-carrier protein adenylyltransferase/sulfurtransferase
MQPPQIDSQELSRKLNGDTKPVVLDVREPKEVQAEGLIAGSLHIPMNEIPARLAEVPHEGEIVAVCKRGQRSWNVAQWLRQQGYDAASLSGGLDAWRASGLPVAR